MIQPSFRQQQVQKTVLSPQLRQFLKLLHQPIIDLKATVQQELVNNPALEEIDAMGDSGLESLDDLQSQQGEDHEGENPEEEWLRYLEDNGASHTTDFSKQSIQDLSKIKSFQETLITETKTLSDHLQEQILLLSLTENDFKIADEIIGSLDLDGYFKSTIDEIAESTETDTKDVHRVLVEIQKLDPPGIAATNLEECLTLQVSKLYREKELYIKIIKNHLNLIAQSDAREIQKVLDTSAEKAQTILENIKRLNPRPGRRFEATKNITILPEAIVSIKEGSNKSEKKLEIEILSQYEERIRINSEYRKLFRNAKSDPETKAYLKGKIQSGIDFLKALELRKSTLESITRELVKSQHTFFFKGYAHLKPLRLKDIAEKLDLHESTISRAIHGKYMMTPQGIVSYKDFFSKRIETGESGDESQKSIMERIKKLIEEENSERPLSDQAIVEKLSENKIKVARRTVAKYRDLLKILPSHLRKKRKSNS